VNKSRWFLLFFLCLSSLLAARETSDITADIFEETSGRGLAIRSNPTGARVFINGVERGSTPVVFENFSSGEYSVRLSKEGYRDRQFSVTLIDNSRLVVSIKMEELRGFASVTVYKTEGLQSLPFNPQIFTNASDEIFYLTGDNKTLLNLPAGYNTIRARAFGWEDEIATVLISEDSTASVDFFMKPAVFRIENASRSRRRFNPLNSSSLGNVEYRFDVSAPGSAVMTVTDAGGSVVYSRQLENFTTWNQRVTWDGRDSYGNPVPEGAYTVLIEASPLFQNHEGEAEISRLVMESEIDYSINIFPLSLTGGIAGLDFAPLPHVLPAGSYQIEAEFLFGNFRLSQSADEKAVTGFPYGIGFRVSPFNNFETAIYFNVNPRVDNSTGWGISVSVKYNILNGGAFPLALAAGVSYAWADRNGDDPLSAGRGIGLHVPLSLELGDFSIILSPALFWRGPDSFAPALLLSTGALYRGGWFTTGFSARVEFDFTENSASPKFLSGLQAHLLLPPSNLFFSVKAGIWTQNSQTGGYGGAGIGLIF